MALGFGHSGGIRITVSLGVAYSAERNRPLQELVRIADDALYAAKRNGRNRMEWALA